MLKGQCNRVVVILRGQSTYSSYRGFGSMICTCFPFLIPFYSFFPLLFFSHIFPFLCNCCVVVASFYFFIIQFCYFPFPWFNGFPYVSFSPFPLSSFLIFLSLSPIISSLQIFLYPISMSDHLFTCLLTPIFLQFPSVSLLVFSFLLV